MHRKLLLLVSLLAVLPGPAAAGYTQLVAFGDSLTDDGNAYLLSGGVWPPSPPYAQRFSNGPVAAEYLAASLGINLSPSVAGGTDYAVGGATTGTANFNYDTQFTYPLPASLKDTGMLSQINQFVAAGAAFDPARTLFFLWAAPNDFFRSALQGQDPFSTAAQAVGNIMGGIATLAAAGATHLFVPNMPDLSLTPLGQAQVPAVRDALAALSLGFDTLLAAALDRMQLTMALFEPDFRLTSFDTSALLGDVTAAPADYGFANVTDACLASTAAYADGCQGYLYFDEVHPTTAAHALLADHFLGAIPAAAEVSPDIVPTSDPASDPVSDPPPGVRPAAVPEPPSWALLATALALAPLVRRRAPAGGRKL